MPLPRVVLVPGLGLRPAAWAPTIASLPVGIDVDVVTLPGFGVPVHGDDLSPRALARRLVSALPPDGPLVLGGHSASCQVVAHAAVLAPSRVRGLLLVGPTTDPRAAGWSGLVRRWLRTAGHETPRQVPSLVRQYAETTLSSALRAMEHARHDRIDKTLSPYDGRILVLRGRCDRICPADWARRVAGRSTAGAVHTLAVGGHMVPLTHGHLVAEALTGLVRSLEDASPPDLEG